MGGYRIYRLDAEGHIRTPPVICECETDHEAVAYARQLLHHPAFEVWKGAVQVYRFEPAAQAENAASFRENGGRDPVSAHNVADAALRSATSLDEVVQAVSECTAACGMTSQELIRAARRSSARDAELLAKSKSLMSISRERLDRRTE